MKRLVFLYLAHRNAEHYFRFFQTEGYFWLIRRMVETCLISDALIIIESGMDSFAELAPGVKGYSVRTIEDIPGGIRHGDIVWVRGAWKSWYPFLSNLKDTVPLLLYAANTGRQRWPFWDVIFDDLAGKDYVDTLGRRHVDFRKPTHPEMFFPMQTGRKYDLCIGASHIHDKKGQWRGVKAVMEYERIFGQKLKCVLPGAFRRGVKTNLIIEDIEKHALDIELPGMLPREQMRNVYNESKLFCHLGSGGQGDRGVLEAMRCGTPVMIGFPKYHAPFTYESDLSYVSADPDHYSTLAYEIRSQIEISTEEKRRRVFEYHEANCGVESVILPKMKKIFQEVCHETI